MYKQNLFYPIAVNLSALQFENKRLFSVLEQLLEKYQIQPHNLILEITESTAMHHIDSSIRTLKRLRKLGIRIAIDDFGTGYSSLSYLHNLPIDTIKIDRSLMVDVAHSTRAQHMLTGIAFLSKKLGLNVVAEGIETKEQADLLDQMGIDFAQGYYYEKPLAEQALDEYCSKIFVGEE